MSTPLRIFIVDDEAPARGRLRTLLDDLAGELPNVVAGEAGDGAQALERLADMAADVVLTDIRMPRMDGIELARHLARLPRAPGLVFVTAYDQYAVTAFELNAIDYLLKPVRAARLAAALARARHAAPPADAVLAGIGEARRHLSCAERGRLLLVPVAEVLYLKAELKYVTARSRERAYLIEESLTHLEQEFAARFVRIHRNCLVAREAIAGFARGHDPDGEPHWQVLLRGLDEQLAVSRRQWPTVKAAVGAAAEG